MKLINLKKWIPMSLLMFFLVMSFLPAQKVSAEEVSLSKETVLSLEKSALLDVLQEKGLILPEDYENHREMAEKFVSKYTPLILEGQIDPQLERFNYSQSNQMMKSLGDTIESMGFEIESSPESAAAYKLKDSTALGTWNDSYRNYNCYAYSIGQTSGLQPGEKSNTYFSMSMSIAEMADVVVKDLDALGYWGSKTATKPSALPDQYFRVICIRKDMDNEDYHFMRPQGASLNTWAHKPGGTQPLKWNYATPAARVWTNEAVAYGRTYPPNISYESDIYYILYKAKNQSGLQAKELTEEDTVVLN